MNCAIDYLAQLSVENIHTAVYVQIVKHSQACIWNDYMAIWFRADRGIKLWNMYEDGLGLDSREQYIRDSLDPMMKEFSDGLISEAVR